MVKQIVIVLNYNGAKITEQNIKEILGPRWAWKMVKLFPAVAFVDGEWQTKEIQEAIIQHNLDVRASWLAGGGDPKREGWWRVTEITLDHLRPSPKWKKEMADLQLAKDCEALIERGLEDLAKRRRKEQEKLRMLREVAELFKTDWPKENG